MSTIFKRCAPGLVCLGGLLASAGCSPSVEPEAASSRAPVPEVVGPPVKSRSVWRSYYALGDADIQPDKVNSTGFACEFPSDEKGVTYFVSALHIAEDRTEPITEAAEAARIYQAIGSVGATEAYGASDGMNFLGILADPPAEGMAEEPSLLYDVVLVQRGKVGLKAMPLAQTMPVEGDKLYLATAVYGGAPASQTAHEAEVLSVSSDGKLEYRFVNERLSLQATDGAPLLDESGAVVGMHLHGDKSETGVTGEGISMLEFWNRYSATSTAVANDTQ
ncbi:hypothetical protein [Rhodopirellula sp. MGV]|uniref:hypothetical protein n=1 Tax=Rhodopirellula sp. MGV TaxID=2023130 RepID=UPI000B95FEAB|nr:hypothetical protein [Rhodopirellula sp. MGV]PNY36545.1 hypothetical protein C2E31_11850 [Rhodopirellula baltica]